MTAVALQNKTANRPLVNEGAEMLVNRIFEQMLASCPRLSYYTPQQISIAKQQWIMGFVENNIRTVEQVRQGMKALRAKEDDYVPSVGKFIGWCKQIDFKDLGLPNVEQLLKRLNHFSSYGFEEIHKFKFRSNAEYWLLTDLYQRNRQRGWKDDTLRNEAEKALKAMAKRIQVGEQIPAPNLTLPKKSESRPLPPDVIDKRFSALRKTLGVSRCVNNLLN
ncbi:phage replication protein P [Nicoletella semolina]|uniref:Phage replication protein P n=1 Tax=Nicoletella semolina TaxID=271160 RepID=A0A4R2NAF5_9PAST|nr:replication protein P [Nicoletella semolina]MDH2923958.1 replication protein [Nicoletella semolina]TCP18081.1 phage replication protein P [Nicoletella semolina]